MTKEIIKYKGFVIALRRDDDLDWVADISKPGDPEGRIGQDGMTRDVALQRAKVSIDKMIGASGRNALPPGTMRA